MTLHKDYVQILPIRDWNPRGITNEITFKFYFKNVNVLSGNKKKINESFRYLAKGYKTANHILLIEIVFNLVSYKIDLFVGQSFSLKLAFLDLQQSILIKISVLQSCPKFLAACSFPETLAKSRLFGSHHLFQN